jgi:hypothetical protein
MARIHHAGRRSRCSLSLGLTLASSVALALGIPALAEERPTAPAVPPGTTVTDTTHLTRILGRYLTPDQRVDYRGLHGSPEDRQVLKTWLADQARVQVALLPERARLAFWLNLYNAATIELVLRHYPLDSILAIDIVPGGVWRRAFIRADGRLLSLDGIQQEILRVEFRDPRIHFALHGASVSSPPLSRQPFTMAELDRQLERATRDFLASRRGLQVQLHDGPLVLRVTRIFDWYREDFESYPGGVVGFVTRFGPEDAAARLRRERGRATLHYLDYDWSLNAPHYGESTSGD